MTQGPLTFGRYTLIRELGRGAFGVVYAAQDPVAGRQVALKVLQGGGQARPERLVRFRREAQLLAQLRHPHVVRVHDAGEARGEPYLVMEWVEGRSLAEELRARGSLAPEEAVGLALQLAQGLEHMHQAGVLHRDLKPSNVLLRDGQAVMVDFGLAKELAGEERLTQTGHMLGTPGYMPLEQACGDRARIGPASDVYALGATLYEALCGRAPHVGESVRELLAVMHSPPAPPSRYQAGIDAELDALCLRCLAAEPEDRFPSAQALGDALARWRDRAGRPARRGGLVALGVTLVLSVGVAAGVLLAGESAPPSAAQPGAPDEPVASAASRAQAQLDAGREALAEGDYGGAVGAFAALVELEPDRVDAWTGLAEARLALFELEPARDAAREAVARSADLAPARALLADAEQRLGQVVVAWEQAQRALELDPQSTRALLVRARVERERGDHAAALRSCEQALGLEPESVDAWAVRAGALCELSVWEASLEATKRLLALAPGHPEAYRIQAELRYRRRQSAQALAALDAHDEAPALRPGAWRITAHDRAMAEFFRARLHYLQTDRDDLALAACDRGLRFAADEPLLWNLRGLACQSLERYEQAAADLQRGLEVADSVPVRAQLLWNLAQLEYDHLDEEARSLETLERLAELNPDYPGLYASRAQALLFLGRFEETLAACDEGERRGQLSADLAIRRGQCLMRLRRYAEAERAFRQAAAAPQGLEPISARTVEGSLQLVALGQALEAGAPWPGPEPQTAEEFHARGTQAMALGRFDLAVQAHSREIALRPSSVNALNARAYARERQGDLQGALDDYRAASALAPANDRWRAQIRALEQRLAAGDASGE